MSAETQTRLTLAVPDASPETSMSLGTTWTGTSWNNDGFCVNTDGRIWLDAYGSTNTSTLTALSNDVSGQLLLQSLKSNVFLIADKQNAVVASGNVLIAGGNSIRIFSAHGTTGLFSGATEGASNAILGIWGKSDDDIGTDYFDRIGPDASAANSNTATAYIDHCEDVREVWTYAFLGQTAWTVLMEAIFFAKGIKGAGGTAANVALVGQLAAISAWIGVRAVSAIISQPGPAGLDMYSLGSVLWATPGFCSLYSLSGTVLSSGFSVGGLGLVSASINAGIGAVLKSPWRIGLDGKKAEAVAGTNMELAAKQTINLMGANVTVGAVGGEAMTQVPTVSIDVHSAKDISVMSPMKVEQKAGGTLEMKAPTIKVMAGTEAVLKSANFEIKLSTTGITVAILKKTKIAMSSGGILVDCMGGTGISVESGGVAVEAGATGISVEPTGAVCWGGPVVSMV